LRAALPWHNRLRGAPAQVAHRRRCNGIDLKVIIDGSFPGTQQPSPFNLNRFSDCGRKRPELRAARNKATANRFLEFIQSLLETAPALQFSRSFFSLLADTGHYTTSRLCRVPCLDVEVVQHLDCRLQVKYVTLFFVARRLNAKANAEHRSGCPVSVSLELLGDRWSLLLVRDMMVRGYRTFASFKTQARALPPIFFPTGCAGSGCWNHRHRAGSGRRPQHLLPADPKGHCPGAGAAGPVDLGRGSTRQRSPMFCVAQMEQNPRSSACRDLSPLATARPDAADSAFNSPVTFPRGTQRGKGDCCQGNACLR